MRQTRHGTGIDSHLTKKKTWKKNKKDSGVIGKNKKNNMHVYRQRLTSKEMGKMDWIVKKRYTENRWNGLEITIMVRNFMLFYFLKTVFTLNNFGSIWKLCEFDSVLESGSSKIKKPDWFNATWTKNESEMENQNKQRKTVRHQIMKLLYVTYY